MKCITYGWVIFLLIIITSIMMILLTFLDNSTPEKLDKNLKIMNIGIHSAIFLLFGWWLYGWVVKCDEGYIWSRGLTREQI